MVVLVTGGRKYANYWRIWRTLDALHKTHNFTKLVHGKGGWTDMSADAWAKARDVPVQDYPAKWNDISRPDAVIREHANGKPYNVIAGFARNQQMLDEEEVKLVVAFPGGHGTADMVAKARKAGVEVIEVTEENDDDPTLLQRGHGAEL